MSLRTSPLTTRNSPSFLSTNTHKIRTSLRLSSTYHLRADSPTKIFNSTTGSTSLVSRPSALVSTSSTTSRESSPSSSTDRILSTSRGSASSGKVSERPGASSSSNNRPTSRYLSLPTGPSTTSSLSTEAPPPPSNSRRDMTWKVSCSEDLRFSLQESISLFRTRNS